MATITEQPRTAPQSLAPDTFEKFLATGAVILLGFVIAAVARGDAEWHLVPLLIWAHLATMIVALGLTPLMLLRRRGDPLHRMLGRVWAGAMVLTAILSLFIHHNSTQHFSIIHILSVWVLIQVPVIVIAARRHNVKRHRRSVRGMVTGALLIAGFFTFPFDRLLGHWLFA